VSGRHSPVLALQAQNQKQGQGERGEGKHVSVRQFTHNIDLTHAYRPPSPSTHYPPALPLSSASGWPFRGPWLRTPAVRARSPTSL